MRIPLVATLQPQVHPGGGKGGAKYSPLGVEKVCPLWRSLATARVGNKATLKAMCTLFIVPRRGEKIFVPPSEKLLSPLTQKNLLPPLEVRPVSTSVCIAKTLFNIFRVSPESRTS